MNNKITNQRRQLTCKITIKNNKIFIQTSSPEEYLTGNLEVDKEYLKTETLRIGEKEIYIKDIKTHIINSLLDFFEKEDVTIKEVQSLIGVY